MQTTSTDREVGFGIRADQVRAVVREHRGIATVARRLGVGLQTAKNLAARAGVHIQLVGPGHRSVISDAQLLAAVLSPRSLSETARRLDVTPAGLHLRARRAGLPTDPAGRAALRAGDSA